MKTILAVSDRDFRESAIRWFANSGPFWEDDRAWNPDDLFYFYDIDVTDQGLGEAARRVLLGTDARGFSFEGAGDTICATPLSIRHGLLEEVLNLVSIHNATRIEEIASEPEVEPDSWEALIDHSRRRLRGLIFSDELGVQLAPYPFHSGIARRAYELLSILNNIVHHTKVDGSLDSRGRELLQMHFVGEKCAFTDESDTNKRHFRTEMTFKDPLDAKNYLFCSWHGKIKMQQFRIHFEWPRANNQREIKVAYLGPKITKS